jgi:YD repeat-containing protein
VRIAPRGRRSLFAIAASLAIALLLLAPPATAGEERYDYDALGRLVRVIDEQGRVTEYVYDAAGNILQVIVSGAGSAQPPVVTSVSETSIRRGETKSVQITGTGLTGAHVATPDPALDVSNLNVSATQITFTLSALAGAALGAHTLSIRNAGGATSVQLTVNPVLPKLDMSPLPIAVPPTGSGRNFFVTLSSADNVDHVVSLASSNPSRVTVSPANVTFAAGETEKIVTVTGLTAGNAAIDLTSPLLASNSVPVFVTAEFAGITTSFAPPLQVVKEQAPGSASTSFGPFASPLVGVAKGAYIEGVAPGRFGVGTGPTALVISGNELGGVTGVTITPSTGLTLGAISVAPDGRSVSVPVTVAANAPATVRKVTLAGSGQPYLAARPGADQILVTLPAPEIDSIDPIFATTGTTAATLTIRGRNLQAPEAVTFSPGSGISVSATPVASADGTRLTVNFSVAPLASAGPHVVRVHTMGGVSDGTASAANTFSVVNEVQAVYTPISAAHLGVVKEDPAPAPEARSAFAPMVGVVVPPAATGIAPAVGIVGETVNLTVSGQGLGGVTALQLFPADGVTVGALSVAPDGLSVSAPLTIALGAPQNLREVRVFAGATQVSFTNAAAALFRVSAPLPQFDSISPIVLQAGAAAVTLTISGRNLQNASAVRVEPPSDVSVSPPTVNAAGTQASVTMSAAAGAATGPRAVILATPAGESPVTQTPANTLTLVSTIQGSVTPVSAAALGVVLESSAPPATQSLGPFVAPELGVVLEAAPTAPPQESARAMHLGVAVGPFATGVQAPPLTPTSTGTLVISGVGLADVTAVQIVPASNVTVGTLTIAPDGTRVEAPLLLSGAAAGLRGVRVLRGAEPVLFVPAGNNTFRIGVGAPGIDSITPILESRGNTFTLLIRGQNFQDAIAVTAEPAAGLVFDHTPTPNAAGTELTVRTSIAPDAPLGARVIRVFTPGGASTDVAIPANTFTVLE